jgi:hypothetical protein
MAAAHVDYGDNHQRGGRRMMLSNAEREQLEALGGVDPQWLELTNLLGRLLLGGSAAPQLVPQQVVSDAASLLANLSTWLRP